MQSSLIIKNNQNKVTKKVKKDKKKAMWNSFDKEFNSENDIECIYRKEGIRECCDLCKSSLLITDEGFMACQNSKCGILYTDVLDQSAEWRFYGGDDSSGGGDPTRCGMPVNPLLKESSFGCKVICNGSTSYEMRKIRRFTEWQSMPYKEKAQYDEFQKIIILSQQSGISRLIIDDAMRYYKMISDKKTFRGLNRDGILAASIYISCRHNNNTRTAREIATIFNLDNTSATRGCKNALTIINEIEINNNSSDKTQLCSVRAETFIERYCSKLSINNELTNLCKFVCINVTKKNLIPENTPQSTSAGVIYFISQVFNLNITKADIWNITNISEVTIGKCYKRLEEYKKTLIPAVLLKKYDI